jgi:uncharacterized protein (DUF433 family)
MGRESKRATADPFRVGKAYSISEAAKLADTSAATVRRWLMGYEAPGHHMVPVFGEKERRSDTLLLSFLELIEVVVASRFRHDDNISLDRIRRAHRFAREKIGVSYPFASNRFRAEGGHVLHEFERQAPATGSAMMAFDLNGQWVLPSDVQDALTNIDFETRDSLAARWFPFGREAHVVVDPHLAGGRPIVEGTRVPISAIHQRFQAGESIDFLADDYGLASGVIEDVLRLAAA